MNEIYEITGSELDSLRRQLADRSVTKLSVAIDSGAKFKIDERSWTPPLGTRKGLREAITETLRTAPDSGLDAMDIALMIRPHVIGVGALEAWDQLNKMERERLVRRVRHADNKSVQAVRWRLV